MRLKISDKGKRVSQAHKLDRRRKRAAKLAMLHQHGIHEGLSRHVSPARLVKGF